MNSAGDIKEFLVTKVLIGKVNEGSADEQNILQYLRKDKVDIPYLYISYGSCGSVAGAGEIIEAVKNYTQDRALEAKIIETGCIGICKAEPLLDIQLPGKNRISFKNVKPSKVPALLDDVFHGLIDMDLVFGQFDNIFSAAWPEVPFVHELPYFVHQQRLVLDNTGIIDPLDIKEYIARGGYQAYVKAINFYTIEQVCEIVEDSCLKGRAGGGFLTGKKWSAAYHVDANQKYLICNAEESDPGAFMDRTIIEGDPHKLIEGIAIASYAIGATKAVIYIRSEYEMAISRIKQAMEDAKQFGLLGENIFNSGYNLDITMMRSPGAFICGEETASINSLEGKRAMPKPKPPYPIHNGLHGKPTVVNNVETLANVPAIIRNGPTWFKEIGSAESPGTKVFSLSGKVKNTGLVEVPMGTSLRQIVFDISGGVSGSNKFKAVHVGGPLGCTLPEDLLDTKVDFQSFKEVNAAMGSGGMVILDETCCVVDLAKYFMEFMQDQSCGKCIPCREGTKRMAEILESITLKPTDTEKHQALERFKGVTQLESLADVMKDTSMCGFGHHASNPIVSTLVHFREEYEEHVFDRHCQAGICSGLKAYYINIDECTGCSVCAKKCPENAIIGTPKTPYFIVEDRCTGCGICFESCKFSAIHLK